MRNPRPRMWEQTLLDLVGLRGRRWGGLALHHLMSWGCHDPSAKKKAVYREPGPRGKTARHYDKRSCRVRGRYGSNPIKLVESIVGKRLSRRHCYRRSRCRAWLGTRNPLAEWVLGGYSRENARFRGCGCAGRVVVHELLVCSPGVCGHMPPLVDEHIECRMRTLVEGLQRALPFTAPHERTLSHILPLSGVATYSDPFQLVSGERVLNSW